MSKWNSFFYSPSLQVDQKRLMFFSVFKEETKTDLNKVKPLSCLVLLLQRPILEPQNAYINCKHASNALKRSQLLNSLIWEKLEMIWREFQSDIISKLWCLKSGKVTKSLNWPESRKWPKSLKWLKTLKKPKISEKTKVPKCRKLATITQNLTQILSSGTAIYGVKVALIYHIKNLCQCNSHMDRDVLGMIHKRPDLLVVIFQQVIE